MNFNTALKLMEQGEIMVEGHWLCKVKDENFWVAPEGGNWVRRKLPYPSIKREDWEIYKKPEALKEVKFYRAFNIVAGRMTLYSYPKENSHIENGFLREGDVSDNYHRITNELIFTAYIDSNNKVVKYILASGEEIVV